MQELLAATRLRLAQDLEEEGELERAEGYLIEAGRWHDAVDMLQSHERGEDALRVAAAHGGREPHDQVQPVLGELSSPIASLQSWDLDVHTS